MRRRASQNKSPATPTSLHGGVVGSVAEPQVRDVPFPISRTLATSTYDVVQTYELPQFHTSSTTLATYVATDFRFSNAPDYLNFAQVFDQYQIAHVHVTFIPSVQQSEGSANLGLFTSVLDYDDAAPLATMGDALSYANALTASGTQMQTRTLVPRIALAAYSGGTFSGYANAGNTWIDAASATVQHYGIKTAWTTTSAVATMAMVVRMHLRFRNVR